LAPHLNERGRQLRRPLLHSKNAARLNERGRRLSSPEGDDAKPRSRHKLHIRIVRSEQNCSLPRQLSSPKSRRMIKNEHAGLPKRSSIASWPQRQNHFALKSSRRWL
jgi:hypothetical protein